jgi:hypothetical protein
MHYAQPLDQLLERQLKAVVKTPDNRGIALISFPWRVKMKDLTNEGTSLAGYYSRKNEAGGKNRVKIGARVCGLRDNA